MDDLAQRLAELPPEKRQLLLQTLHQQGERFNTFPLSFAQERLWFLDQWAPGAPVYTLLVALRMTGPLHIAALAQSLQTIIQRHEALRTIFVAVAGQPLQLVQPPSPLALPLLDLSAIAAPARAALVERLLHAAARQPFVLNQGPLLRPALLKLHDQQHLLLLAMHHIITDGWSLGVLVRELTILYAARHGSPATLAPLPIQYPDFALWQRQWCDSDQCASQLDYWRRTLAGAPPLLALPTDYPRPPIQTFRGARQLCTLPAPLVPALRGYCQALGGTLFMGLLAAFALLLARISGQDELLIGAPIAGRNRGELAGLIGCFLNSLVLRIDLTDRPSFQALFARVQAVCLGAYAHQDLPFERLLAELQPQRELSHTPLFQVFFNMLNYPAEPIALPELAVETLAPPEVAAKFDLTLYVTEQAEQIELELVYNTDLFGAARMAELLAQYQQLLAQAVAQPERPLYQHSLVTPTARAYLPDTSAPLDAGWIGAVQSGLSRQAQRQPARLAVIDAHERWSYAELDRRSNQLAHELIAQGIRRQDVVAIYGHRSAALVWAIFGVLKAGAAFMILDPAYPPARLAEYLDSAQPRGWVQIAAAGACPAELEQHARSLVGQRHITLRQRDAALAQEPADYSCADPGVAVGPDDRACVTFTSGSIGRPKGIIGRHGPLSHFLPWQSQAFGLGADDRFCMLSGLSHDPLQRDIFTPLWLGATLCIPYAPDIMTPDRLVEWLRQEAITVAHLTPALAQIMTRTTPTAAPPTVPSLRYAFIVGDVLTTQDIARIRVLAPAVTCVNFYGSTETQRAVGYYIVPADAAGVKEILPLGRGMQDVQLLVLNSAGQLAGVGELGEIYMRSPHLAGGYIAEPALTAARFVPDPFATTNDERRTTDDERRMTDDERRMTDDERRMTDDEDSDRACVLRPASCVRLYKTGDLGRYLPDGNVEFCGRADDQVKVRGFRVEPGEIASLLRRHPAVRNAVVVARADAPGEQRLVAYVVTTADEGRRTIDDGGYSGPSSFVVRPSSVIPDLRASLRERLPAYMIPASFVLLDALPLTPNGKLDRRKLPAPEQPQRQQAHDYAAPQTALEQLIAGIWQRVLTITAVGTNDNFFDLGGNSIQMVQVCSALQDALKREIAIVELFQYPTVGALSRYLGHAGDDHDAQSTPPEIQDRVQKQHQSLDRQRRLRSRIAEDRP
jgi:amino acid adenylation domain-containing protein